LTVMKRHLTPAFWIELGLAGISATRREHQKIGKLVTEGDFEKYGQLLKDIS